MRYSFQRYNTILASDNTQFSHDFYQAAELMAGTNISNKWQLLMFLPYNHSHTKSDDGIKQNNGLGDLTWIGNYNLLVKKSLKRETVTVFQQLWIGAGIKVPTGRFTVDSSELISSANLQPGTGSLDFLLNAMYTFQVEGLGVNLNTNYKYNLSADNYKFGNRLSATTFVFHPFHLDKVTISPNIGLLFEILGKNSKDHEKVVSTGGNALLSAIGLELRYKNIEFGCNAQLPLSSDLSGGQTSPGTRGMCHVSYMF